MLQRANYADNSLKLGAVAIGGWSVQSERNSTRSCHSGLHRLAHLGSEPEKGMKSIGAFSIAPAAKAGKAGILDALWPENG